MQHVYTTSYGLGDELLLLKKKNKNETNNFFYSYIHSLQNDSSYKRNC